MKKVFALVFLVLLMASATGPKESSKAAKPSIEGTWELVSFYNYVDGINISDTIPAAEGYRQIKMYYNGKVMWTRYVPTDSVEWFGYGSYKSTDSTLTEVLEYMSASMRKVARPDMVWDLELVLGKDTFTQIFTDEDGNRINAENYKRLD